MQHFCQELNHEKETEIKQSLFYHWLWFTFPPWTQRPSSPPPASPASGPGSPGILHLQTPPQPLLTMPSTPSNTPQRSLTPLHLPLGSPKCERKERVVTASVDLPGNKDVGELRHKGGRAPGRLLPLLSTAASQILVC